MSANSCCAAPRSPRATTSAPTPPPPCLPTGGCAPATSPTSSTGNSWMCGRIKDVIIVGGRNVFPEDIERAVGPLDSIHAGNVIALRCRGVQGQGVGRGRGRDTPDRHVGWPRRRGAPPIHERTLDVCGPSPTRRHARRSRARSRRPAAASCSGPSVARNISTRNCSSSDDAGPSASPRPVVRRRRPHGLGVRRFRQRCRRPDVERSLHVDAASHRRCSRPRRP